jgi:hypothetical protein
MSEGECEGVIEKNGDREADSEFNSDLDARPVGEALKEELAECCSDTVETADSDATTERLMLDAGVDESNAVMDIALREGKFVIVTKAEVLVETVAVTEVIAETEEAPEVLGDCVFPLGLATEDPESAELDDGDRDGDRLILAEVLADALSLEELVSRASIERLEDWDAEPLVEGEAVADGDALEEVDATDDEDEDGDRLADAEKEGEDTDVLDAEAQFECFRDSDTSADGEAEGQLEDDRDTSEDGETRGDLDTLRELRALGDTVTRGLADSSVVFDACGDTDIFPDVEADVDTLREIGGEREALDEMLSRPLGSVDAVAERDTRGDADMRADPDADREMNEDRDADTECEIGGVSVAIDGFADEVAELVRVWVAEVDADDETRAEAEEEKDTRAERETLTDIDIVVDNVGDVGGDIDPEDKSETDTENERRELDVSEALKVNKVVGEKDPKDAEKDALGVRDAEFDADCVAMEADADRDVKEVNEIDGDTVGVDDFETDRVSLVV